MRFFDNTWSLRTFVWHHIVAPAFGGLCFLIGAAALFLVPFGRWRVRRWPAFSQERAQRLEPWKTRSGLITYFCADAALFIGFATLILIPLVILGLRMSLK